MTRAGKIRGPESPAMHTKKKRLATVMRNIHGQMRRSTVASFGSGSDLSFGLKIRYDLEEERFLMKGLLKKNVDQPSCSP